MNNTIIQNANQCKSQDKVNIGKTTYIVTNIFQDKVSLDNAWLAIIARMESTKNN